MSLLNANANMAPPAKWTAMEDNEIPALEEISICSSFDSNNNSDSDSDTAVVKMLSAVIKKKIHSKPLNKFSPPKSLAHKLQVERSGAHSVGHHSPRPLVIGHRGSLYHEVENTIEGFVKAHQLGCDAVELDVFLLKCGTLVVFHGNGCDQNPGLLDTYCGTEGCILDYTAQEAKTLLKLVPHAGEFGYFGSSDKLDNVIIPTLEEVLVVCKEIGLIVKIELKGENTVEPVLELVERLDMVHMCHFASFHLGRVQLVREMRPDKTKYRTAALYSSPDPPPDFLDFASTLGVNEIHLRYDACTKDRIEAVHAAGFVSMAWFRGPNSMLVDASTNYLDVGNEDESMYETVLSSGVQSMCVNRPDVLLNLLSRRAAVSVSAPPTAFQFVTTS